jgi:putative endonuclease
MPSSFSSKMSPMTNEDWFVYIISTASGKLYTGITKDLERRFTEHATNKKGARFFHFSTAEALVYQESHPDRSSASKRECEIKKMSRKEKLALIPISVVRFFRTTE